MRIQPSSQTKPTDPLFPSSPNPCDPSDPWSLECNAMGLVLSDNGHEGYDPGQYPLVANREVPLNRQTASPPPVTERIGKRCCKISTYVNYRTVAALSFAKKENCPPPSQHDGLQQDATVMVDYARNRS